MSDSENEDDDPFSGDEDISIENGSIGEHDIDEFLENENAEIEAEEVEEVDDGFVNNLKNGDWGQCIDFPYSVDFITNWTINLNKFGKKNKKGEYKIDKINQYPLFNGIFFEPIDAKLANLILESDDPIYNDKMKDKFRNGIANRIKRNRIEVLHSQSNGLGRYYGKPREWKSTSLLCRVCFSFQDWTWG